MATIAVLAAPLLLVSAGRAGAEDDGAEAGLVLDPYEVRWALDLPVLGAAALAWAAPQLFLDDLVTPSCPCDAATINPLDRWIAGRDVDGIAVASDSLLALGVVAPLALEVLDARGAGAGWSTVTEDAVVMAQAVVVAGALTQAVKLGVRRPRPLVYGAAAGDPVLDEPDSYLSFYSAHTATTFAAGLSFASTYVRRHPGTRLRPVVYGGAVALGATTGLLRMLSGRHFTSDVLAGATVGTLTGLGGPWLHDRRRPWAISVAPAGDGAIIVVAGALP